MKIKSLLIAMLAIVSFASCSQNDDETQTGNNESGALVVKFGDAVSSRAIDGPITGDKTPELTNVSVFLVDNAGGLSQKKTMDQAEMAAKKCVFEQVAKGTVKSVLVVANISADEQAAVDTLTSAEAVRKFAFSIEDQSSTAANPGVKHVTLMGEGNTFTPETTGTDGHAYTEVSVALDALVARIEVGTVAAGKGVKNIVLNAVYVNNYYENGAKANVVLNDSKSPFWTTNFGKYSETEYMHMGDSIVNGDGSQCYAFQVFAGNVPHVLLCVSGEYENGTEFDDQWVTFTRYKLGSDYIDAMNVNNVYSLGHSITVNADDITPEPEMGKIDLGVVITVTNWTVNSVTPEV